MSKLQEKDVMAAAIMQEHDQSIRSIAETMGVDESTLRYRLKRFRSGVKDGRKSQPEKCSAHNDVIMEWVENHVILSQRPRPIKELYETLVCEYGYIGSYRAVLRYVRRRLPRPRIRPHRRFESRPGTQTQADWFKKRVWINELGGEVMLNAFVIVLSFSRAWAVVWTVSQDMLNWIDCHNQAFRKLGGIAVSNRIDNLKTGVSKGAGAWAELNPGYESYAAQMGFIIDPARPRMGSDKGKVERRGRDVKRIPVQSGEKFSTVAELQQLTDERVSDLYTELTCPVTGKSIYESWVFEQKYLRPLPETLPDAFDVQVSRTVTDTCLVNFESRQYEVPARYVGLSMIVRGCAGRVKIYNNSGELIRTYPRRTDCRLLLDRTMEDFEGDERVVSPTPLGKLAREIVLEKSWEYNAPSRAIEEYSHIVSVLS